MKRQEASEKAANGGIGGIFPDKSGATKYYLPPTLPYAPDSIMATMHRPAESSPLPYARDSIMATMPRS